MSELNARQWRLYNQLKALGDVWTKQRELAELLPDLYPCERAEAFHDSGARLLMTKDIREINKSDVIQKIIISSAQGVKLASKEEARAFIAGKYSAAFKSLETARKMERKAGLDGQARLVFGRERGIIEAFTDSGVSGPPFSFTNTASNCKQIMNLQQTVDF